ncbi:MAG: hypothetical protein V2I34_08330 [Bacteroidales bacterium]|jgi:hypothetical protein|nr:hypothetical protein [Bacteroidales bacterium]
MNKRTLIILEILWVVIGIFCIAAAIHNKMTSGGERFLILLGMGVLSFIMAYVRDRQRRKNNR